MRRLVGAIELCVPAHVRLRRHGAVNKYQYSLRIIKGINKTRKASSTQPELQSGCDEGTDHTMDDNVMMMELTP